MLNKLEENSLSMKSGDFWEFPAVIVCEINGSKSLVDVFIFNKRYFLNGIFDYEYWAELGGHS